MTLAIKKKKHATYNNNNNNNNNLITRSRFTYIQQLQLLLYTYII